MRKILLLFFAWSLWVEAAAFEVPPLTDSVVDEAAVLPSETRTKLSNALKVIFQKGGPQVAVLTVKTIDDLTIEEASYKVAKAWQLGTAQKDNGVLLMVANKERKIRIEVGQGVEGDLTDAYSRRIIDLKMVPLFREGAAAAGILVGVDAILNRMNPPLSLQEFFQQEFLSQPAVKVDWAHLILIICFLVFLMAINGHGGGGRGLRRGLGLPGGLYGGGFGGGGFGGSSGWGGGGGGFSGGGASGSW